MNWVDIAVAIMIGIEVFKCFKEGMVKTVIQLAGLIVSLILAKLYYETLAVYLSSNYDFFKTLQPKVYQALTQNFDSGAQVSTAVSEGTLSRSLNLPQIMSLAPEAQKANVTETINQAVFGELSIKIADMLLYGLSFVMIVVGLMACIMVLTFIVDHLMGLPVLKEVNKLGGIVIGFAKGSLNVFVLMTVLTFIMPFLKSKWLIEAIQESSVAVYFYNNNLLLYLVYYLLK